MNALIRKDLRENLKAALIGLLIFSLLLLKVYWACVAALTGLLDGHPAGSVGELQPLLVSGLLVETTFFCAIFGVALGWLQTRNEAHRDLWAFLIHRPVTRTGIFLGKAIAGLCLYFFAAGLPLAVLVLMVRIPGHVAAPFEWAMTLPLFLAFLTGLAWYFAGLLTGLRQARWYASRAFGLVIPFLTSLGLSTSLVGWPLLFWIAFAVLILAAAVWGAYQTGGHYRGQPVIARLATIITMLAGCGGAIFVGMALFFALLSDFLPQHFPVYSSYQMTKDGLIYKVSQQGITDLEGHPLLNPKTGRDLDRQEFEKHFANAVTGVPSRFHRGLLEYYGSQDFTRFFFLAKISGQTLWYLDRHGQMTGYDARSRRRIGSLNPQIPGRNPPSEPFLTWPNFSYPYTALDETSKKIFSTAGALYQVDFGARAVKPIFLLTNDDEIGGCCFLAAGYDDLQRQNILITTRRTVRLLDAQGQAIFEVPYQPGYAEYPLVQTWLLEPTNGSKTFCAVWFHPDGELNLKADWKMPIHVLWLSTDGGVAKSADLPFLRPPTPEDTWPEKLAGTLLAPPWFNPTMHHRWDLFNWAAALICAVIGWSLARRHNYSTGAGIGWALFISLMGFAGLLTFLCVQEWPPRLCCPNCKKPRSVDRAFCEHCQSPFSPPDKNGTEIFEPLVRGQGLPASPAA